MLEKLDKWNKKKKFLSLGVSEMKRKKPFGKFLEDKKSSLYRFFVSIFEKKRTL